MTARRQTCRREGRHIGKQDVGRRSLLTGAFWSRISGENHSVGDGNESGGEDDEDAGLDALEGPEPTGRLIVGGFKG
jgi:hypothetical protein